MSTSNSLSVSRFYYSVEDKVEGPFDLIDLAAELKYGHINADTLICREGTEEWIVFRDLPEFASAQEMSVETIARRLEAKMLPGQAPLSPKQVPPLVWIGGIAVVCLLGLAGLAFVFAPAPLAPAPPPPPQAAVQTPVPHDWVTTIGDRFSILCPVEMKRDSPSYGGKDSSYKATTAGAGYVVQVTIVPGAYSDADYNEAIFQMKAGFFGKANSPHLTTEKVTTKNGFSIHDILFSKEVDSAAFPGGIRVVAGNGMMAFAMVTGKSDKVSDEEINRFMTSFRVW